MEALEEGCVYVLTNPYMPGFVKVGFTGKSPTVLTAFQSGGGGRSAAADGYVSLESDGAFSHRMNGEPATEFRKRAHFARGGTMLSAAEGCDSVSQSDQNRSLTSIRNLPRVTSAEAVQCGHERPTGVSTMMARH